MSDQPQQTTAPAKPEWEEHWLRRPSTIRILWRAGLALLAVTALLDLVIEPHPHFGIDGTFGFYSWYGLLTCVAMVLVAKGLGILLKRPDDYYDD